MPRTTFLLGTLLLLGHGALHAQVNPREPGPVVHGAGEVYRVDAPDMPTPSGHTYRAVFEVVNTADVSTQVNQTLNSAARFLNMHAQAGVPAEQLHLAMVVHGPAGRDLLNDDVYRERFGTPNPNTPLLEELSRAGVRVILCGQTAAARNLPRDALAPTVEVALSAMTAFVLLQDEGYRLIPF
jgi:intracellular sulfur oxidation DsrE/DsrF family protein